MKLDNEMTLEDFLSKDPLKRKVLIVGNPVNGRRLLQEYEKRKRKTVSAVSCLTLADFGKELFFKICVEGEDIENPFEKSYTIINDRMGTGLLRKVFLENHKNFESFKDVSPQMFEGNVIGEMYRVMTQLRRNSLIEGGSIEDLPNRVKDLINLAESYETKLKECRQIDTTGIYRYITDRTDKIDTLEDPLDLYWDSVRCIGVLDDGTKYSELEKKFLHILSKTMKKVFEDNAGVKKVTLYDSEIIDCNKWSFLSGYGLYNEARAIVFDILNKKREFGDVEIICQSEAQLPFFEAAFGEVGIPCCFLAKRKVVDNPVLLKFQHILDYAELDFSEESFKKLFGFLPRNRDYTVGWGFDRNLEFFNRKITEKQDALKNVESDTDNKVNMESDTDNEVNEESDTDSIKEKKERSLAFWTKCRDVLMCFSKSEENPELMKKVTVSGLYNKILAWIKEDSTRTDENEKKKINGFYQILKGDFTEIGRYFEYSYGDTEYSLSDVIRIIRSELNNIKKEDSEREDSVLISKFTGYFKPYRHHLYVSGLSMKEFEGSQIESAFISDAEISEFYGNKMLTLSDRNKIKVDDMNKMISGFKGDSITFSYAFYDTTESCETAPAPYFRSLLERKGKKLEEVPRFMYGEKGLISEEMTDNAQTAGKEETANEEETAGKEETKTVTETSENEETKTVTETAENEETKTDTNDNRLKAIIKKGLETSVSGLEVFVDCPKRFFYERVLGMSDEEAFEKDQEHWLPVNEKGNFCHKVLQEYADEVYLKGASGNGFDEESFELIFKKISDVMKNKIPVAISQLSENEITEIENGCKNYLNQLDTELKSNNWNVLAAEYEFKNVEFRISKDGELRNNNTGVIEGDYKFVLIQGFIDRIDYRIDDNEKMIHLRVIDYKTGKYDRKVTEVELGRTLQNDLYLHILKNESVQKDLLDRIKKISNGKTPDDHGYSVDEFCYDFPLEESSEKYHYTVKGSIGLKRLACFLSSFDKTSNCPTRNIYLDNLKEDKKLVYTEKMGCKFCVNRELCKDSLYC